MEPERTPSNGALGIPLAIFAGFALVAAAIYFTGTGSSQPAVTADNTDTTTQPAQTPESVDIPAVTEDDYIRGNPNAPIMLVEYSDYDCPFCKRFHDTMKQIMDEYGSTGDVGWVYRHMPLEQLHPNAPAIAQAAECVGELGGNDAFWTFSDLIFDERGTNEPTNMALLPEFAERAGVAPDALAECQASGRYQEEIRTSIQTAFDAGARGTPHTFVLVGDQQASINGAQPYGNVKQVIDNLRAQLGRE